MQTLTKENFFSTKLGFLKLVNTDESLSIQQYCYIGRNTQCELAIDDPFVSSRHCKIEKHDEIFIIKDLKSKNGTFVNSTLIIESKLKPGDEIQIGQTKILFTDNVNSKSFFVSRNKEWNSQLELLPTIAISPFPVLLTGESGVGKDVIANHLHLLSHRKFGPYVSVNCGGFHESLIESELFGHKKGSFTGADGDRKGAFEEARGGTLFLDEIGDLPMELQSKLLRALQNNEIKPLGSDKIIKTDVRIITATHQYLEEKIHSGEFRLDLYYRLNVIPVRVPALRARMMDFDNILLDLCKDLQIKVLQEGVELLKTYIWPGNIRELKNVLQRVSVIKKTEVVTKKDLELILKDTNIFKSRTSKEMPIYRAQERELIVEQLKINFGNQRLAAKTLGMPKSTLHGKIKFYGIDPHVYK